MHNHDTIIYTQFANNFRYSCLEKQTSVETQSFGSKFIATRKLVLDVAYILYDIHLQQRFFPIVFLPRSFCCWFLWSSSNICQQDNQVLWQNISNLSHQWRIVPYYMYDIEILQAFQAWPSCLIQLWCLFLQNPDSMTYHRFLCKSLLSVFMLDARLQTDDNNIRCGLIWKHLQLSNSKRKLKKLLLRSSYYNDFELPINQILFSNLSMTIPRTINLSISPLPMTTSKAK